MGYLDLVRAGMDAFYQFVLVAKMIENVIEIGMSDV